MAGHGAAPASRPVPFAATTAMYASTHRQAASAPLMQASLPRTPPHGAAAHASAAAHDALTPESATALPVRTPGSRRPERSRANAALQSHPVGTGGAASAGARPVGEDTSLRQGARRTSEGFAAIADKAAGTRSSSGSGATQCGAAKARSFGGGNAVSESSTSASLHSACSTTIHTDVVPSLASTAALQWAQPQAHDAISASLCGPVSPRPRVQDTVSATPMATSMCISPCAAAQPTAPCCADASAGKSAPVFDSMADGVQTQASKSSRKAKGHTAAQRRGEHQDAAPAALGAVPSSELPPLPKPAAGAALLPRKLSFDIDDPGLAPTDILMKVPRGHQSLASTAQSSVKPEMLTTCATQLQRVADEQLEAQLKGNTAVPGPTHSTLLRECERLEAMVKQL